MKERKKESGLGTAAFVLSLLGCTSLIGLLLGIIDVATGKKDKNHSLGMAAIIIPIVYFIGGFLLGVLSPAISKYVEKSRNSSEATVSQDNNSQESETTTEEINESISVAEDFLNMKSGEIAKIKDLYIGLNYAKRSDVLKNAIDETENVAPENEVVFGFFEMYNSGNDLIEFSRDSITCYADSVQVNPVETDFYYVEDGIKTDNSYSVDGGKEATVLVNFEIPRDWKELRFYYNSDCVWVLTQEDVSTDAYSNKSLYEIENEQVLTAENTIIYSDDYNVTYDGCEIYNDSNMFFSRKYIVFKYTVENNTSAPIDYDLAGHEMRAYHNNHLIQGASYVLDEKIGEYSNIFNVSTIQPGMTAKIYIAFETFEDYGNFSMTYDTGYITSDILGTVNINIENLDSSDESN